MNMIIRNQATAHLPLIMRADSTGSAIYIDGAHEVHADIKGHTGVMATDGVGASYTSSTKNKLEKLPQHLVITCNLPIASV